MTQICKNCHHFKFIHNLTASSYEVKCNYIKYIDGIGKSECGCIEWESKTAENLDYAKLNHEPVYDRF